MVADISVLFSTPFAVEFWVHRNTTQDSSSANVELTVFEASSKWFIWKIKYSINDCHIPHSLPLYRSTCFHMSWTHGNDDDDVINFPNLSIIHSIEKLDKQSFVSSWQITMSSISVCTLVMYVSLINIPFDLEKLWDNTSWVLREDEEDVRLISFQMKITETVTI